MHKVTWWVSAYSKNSSSELLTWIQCICTWPSRVLLKELGEVQRIVQALGETVTANCFMESQGCAIWFSAPANSTCFGICVHDTSHDILSILVILPMPVWSDPAVQTQSCLPPGLGEVTQYQITDACPEFWLRPYSNCYSMQSGTAAFRPHPSSTLAETGHGGWWDSPNIGPATFVLSAKNKVRWNPFMTTPRRMQSACTWGIQSTNQGQSDK